MAELVGFAKCPCCKFEKAGVFKNKRGKLVLNCRKVEGGDGCSTFLFQSNSAQDSLKKMTRFISENPAQSLSVSEEVKPPVVEPEAVPEVSESVPVPAPENVQKEKNAFSFFR